MSQDNLKFLKHLLLSEARAWIGTSFIHQGRSKKIDRDRPGGVDCIGLIVGISENLCLRNLKNELISSKDNPNYSRLAYKEEYSKLIQEMNDNFVKVDSFDVGDVLLFTIGNRPQHLGFVGEKDNRLTLIHAYQSCAQVVEHDLTKNWVKRITGIYRWPQLHLALQETP